MRTNLILFLLVGLICLANCENPHLDLSSEPELDSKEFNRQSLLFSKLFISDDHELLILMTPVNSNAENSDEYKNLKMLSTVDPDMKGKNHISLNLRYIIAKTITGYLNHIKSLALSCNKLDDEEINENAEDLPHGNSVKDSKHYFYDPFVNYHYNNSQLLANNTKKHRYVHETKSKNSDESDMKEETEVNLNVEAFDFISEAEELSKAFEIGLEDLNTELFSGIHRKLSGNIHVEEVKVDQYITSFLIRLAHPEARSRELEEDSRKIIYVIFSDKVQEAIMLIQRIKMKNVLDSLAEEAADFFIPELQDHRENFGANSKECTVKYTKLFAITFRKILENFPDVEREIEEKIQRFKTRDLNIYNDSETELNEECCNYLQTLRLLLFPKFLQATEGVETPGAIGNKERDSIHFAALDSKLGEEKTSNDARTLVIGNFQKLNQGNFDVEISIRESYAKNFSFIPYEDDKLKSPEDNNNRNSTAVFYTMILVNVPFNTDINGYASSGTLKETKASASVKKDSDSVSEANLKSILYKTLPRYVQFIQKSAESPLQSRTNFQKVSNLLIRNDKTSSFLSKEDSVKNNDRNADAVATRTKRSVLSETEVAEDRKVNASKNIHVMIPLPQRIIARSEIRYVNNNPDVDDEYSIDQKSNLTFGLESLGEARKLIKKPLTKLSALIKKLHGGKYSTNIPIFRPYLPRLMFQRIFNNTALVDIRRILNINGNGNEQGATDDFTAGEKNV